MTVQQTVEIPPDRRLFIDVPPEIPVETVILSFTPVSTISKNKDLEYAEKTWAYNRTHPEELKAKLQKLQGCLGENAFGGMDGAAYQCKVRGEWDD